MNEFETVAWVKSARGLIQLPVIVSYESDNGHPLIYGVFELADPDNDLTTHISDEEHDLIYSKVMTHLASEQAEAAEYFLEGER